MKTKFNILLILVISLLTGAVVTCAAGLGSLAHLSDRNAYESEEEVRSVLMKGTGRASIVFSDAGTDDPGRYINRLRIDLYPKEEKPLELKVTVKVREPGALEETVDSILYDTNPVYVTTEVLRLHTSHVTTVELETLDQAVFSVGSVSIDNGFRFSIYLFIFVSASAGALLFVIRSLVLFLKKQHGENYGEGEPAPVGDSRKLFRGLFAVVALTVGIALAICLPRSKVGCDEETHLQAVLQIASFPSGELHVSSDLMNQVTVTEYNNPEAQPGSIEEQNQLNEALGSRSDYRTGERTPEFSVLWNRIPAYLLMSAAMKAGKGIGLSWDVLILLVRIVNLFMYVGLILLALRFLPSGHALMTLIALFPQNLFLAATVSYDPFVTGCLFAGIALCFRLIGDETVTGRRFFIYAGLMVLFFGFGCLPKAVYAPLFLLALMVPFRRISNKKVRTGFTVTVIVLVLAAFLAFVLPTLLHPSASGDVRGGEVSEMSQLEFIFKNPFTFTGILLSQMIRWIPQCIFGADCTVFMGHLVNGSTVFKGCSIPVLVLLAGLTAAGIVLMILKRRKPTLKAGERIWTVVMCFGTSALIWTAMYVAFTEPGATEIGGVQGRYFIPVMFPLYFALGAELPSEPGSEACAAGTPQGLSGRLLFLVRKEQLWYHIMMIVMVITLALQYLRAVVIPCCL